MPNDSALINWGHLSRFASNLKDKFDDVDDEIFVANAEADSIRTQVSALMESIDTSNNRISNIIAQSGTSDTEVVDARHSNVTDKSYVSLVDRLDAMEYYVTPQMYGAFADGSHDDTQAIIDALDAADTVYIPSGTYIVSETIVLEVSTTKNNKLMMSPSAILKAASNFSGDYIIDVGITWGTSTEVTGDKVNNISAIGYQPEVYGGIIDCNSICGGIAVKNGRNHKIHGITIMNCPAVGIYVAYGANNGSSDCDIYDCTINGVPGVSTSIGIQLDGHDNTVQNVRIQKTWIGLNTNSNGNNVNNVHPLFITTTYEDYHTTFGFYIRGTGNTFVQCYSDNYSTGFCVLDKGAVTYINTCWCMWYDTQATRELVLQTNGKMNLHVSGLFVGFHPSLKNGNNTRILHCANYEVGGNGYITNIGGATDGYLNADEYYETFARDVSKWITVLGGNNVNIVDYSGRIREKIIMIEVSAEIKADIPAYTAVFTNLPPHSNGVINVMAFTSTGLIYPLYKNPEHTAFYSRSVIPNGTNLKFHVSFAE